MHLPSFVETLDSVFDRHLIGAPGGDVDAILRTIWRLSGLAIGAFSTSQGARKAKSDLSGHYHAVELPRLDCACIIKLRSDKVMQRWFPFMFRAAAKTSFSDVTTSGECWRRPENDPVRHLTSLLSQLPQRDNPFC